MAIVSGSRIVTPSRMRRCRFRSQARDSACEVGAVIDAEGVIRFARHRGDRPRLIRPEPRQRRSRPGPSNTTRPWRHWGGSDPAPAAPNGVERHQPGIDLGRTDAHSGVIVASLGDPHRSPIGVAHDAAVAAGILERLISPPWRRTRAVRRGAWRRLKVPGGGGRCRGQRAGRPPAVR